MKLYLMKVGLIGTLIFSNSFWAMEPKKHYQTRLMNKHQQAAHLLLSLINTPAPNYGCLFCDMSFSSLQEVKEHEILHCPPSRAACYQVFCPVDECPLGYGSWNVPSLEIRLSLLNIIYEHLATSHPDYLRLNNRDKEGLL